MTKKITLERKSSIYLLSILIIGILIGYLFSFIVNNDILRSKGFEEQRKNTINQLQFSIEKARKEGKYECCIEPPCDMCFLGHFMWENGECHCDQLILEGKEPCPQCEHGLAEDGSGSCPVG